MMGCSSLFSKRTTSSQLFVPLMGFVFFHSLICNNNNNNNNNKGCYVLALSFGASHRSHGAAGGNNNNPMMVQLCVKLDSDDKEDLYPEQAICCFNDNIELRGGGGGDEMVVQTTTTTTPPPTTTTEALLENHPTLKALLRTLQSIHFWNDALQEFRQRLTLRQLMKVAGLGRINEMEEAPEDVERFADDDEMVQIMGVRKWWPIIPSSDSSSSSGAIEKSVGVALVRASTLFERHETSAALHVRPGPLFEGEWENGNGTWGWGWSISPTFNLGALMSSSPDDDDGQQSTRFSPFANIVMGAGESLCFVKQQQNEVEEEPAVFLRFIQKGVLSTGHLPRYVSNLNGYVARVRDYNERTVFETSGSPYWEYTSIAPVSSYFKGTVELEIPTKSILQGSFVKVFGDVSFAHGICRRAGEEENTVSPFDNIIRKSCIGAGIYKVPFRFGVSYSEDGRAGISFGLTDGSDY